MRRSSIVERGRSAIVERQWSSVVDSHGSVARVVGRKRSSIVQRGRGRSPIVESSVVVRRGKRRGSTVIVSVARSAVRVYGRKVSAKVIAKRYDRTYLGIRSERSQREEVGRTDRIDRRGIAPLLDRNPNILSSILEGVPDRKELAERRNRSANRHAAGERRIVVDLRLQAEEGNLDRRAERSLSFDLDLDYREDLENRAEREGGIDDCRTEGESDENQREDENRKGEDHASRAVGEDESRGDREYHENRAREVEDDIERRKAVGRTDQTSTARDRIDRGENGRLAPAIFLVLRRSSEDSVENRCDPTAREVLLRAVVQRAFRSLRAELPIELAQIEGHLLVAE